MKDNRWTGKKTIKRKLVPCPDHHEGGNVIYRDGNHAWKYTGSGHVLYLGNTGSGKTCSGIIPTILDLKSAGESIVVTDPKGDVYEATSAHEHENYIEYVIDFRNPHVSDGYDPLHIIWEFYRSKEPTKVRLASKMLYELACSLYPEKKMMTDMFWTYSARDLFMGVMYALMDEGDESKINILSAHHMVAAGEGRFGANFYLKEYVDRLDPKSSAALLMRAYVDGATETRKSILASYMEGLSVFVRDQSLLSMFAAEGLKIEELDGTKPTIIYIILPDESKDSHNLCGVLSNQLMRYYIHLANQSNGHRLPIRVNMVLEELGNIGSAFDSLSNLLSAGRSRNIRCHLVLQSLTQLHTLYGPDEASTITENASVLVAFRLNHWGTLTELSHKCGTWELECNGQILHEPVISQKQLAMMETGQALVMVPDKRLCFVSKLPHYEELFSVTYSKLDLRVRSMISEEGTKELELFDIKEVMKERKRKELEEQLKRVEIQEEEEDLPFDRRGRLIPSHPPFPGRPFGPRVEVVDMDDEEFDEMENQGLFGGLGGGIDLDAMMRDIDRMIAELDEKEKASEE
ncbi:MAG: type IV secretory system conjugative DNA transfer family protein [Firmicutes bacterium]|nr:type IV secretory system conjugative DNA transfer family protein [Bacillota bacterium]